MPYVECIHIIRLIHLGYVFFFFFLISPVYICSVQYKIEDEKFYRNKKKKKEEENKFLT